MKTSRGTLGTTLAADDGETSSTNPVHDGKRANHPLCAYRQMRYI